MKDKIKMCPACLTFKRKSELKLKKETKYYFLYICSFKGCSFERDEPIGYKFELGDLK